MGSREIFIPTPSKFHDHFQYIPFVSSSGKLSNVTKESDREKNVCNNNLNGKDASSFYQEVISSPTTNSAIKDKTGSKSVKKIINSSTLCNTRLTIFHHAQNGNIDGIKHCFSNHCPVDVQDMYGWTPLMCATFEGHYAVAKYLIKSGANLFVKNKQGLTVFDIAVKQNHAELIKLFKNGIEDKLVGLNPVDIEVKRDNIKYCNSCNCSYEESPTVHERSIVHLFSSRNNDISTYYGIPENNKGFQIMLKKGWNKNNGLGLHAKGRKFPIKTVLKTDRSCIGSKKEVSKVTHFGPNDFRSIKINQPTLNLKKEKRLKKQEIKKLEMKNRLLEIEFRRQFKL